MTRMRLLSRFPHAPSRALLVAATVLAVGGGLVGCGGASNTDCGLNGCTITFPRTGDSTVSVLGVSAELVGVDGGQATVRVAGQTVSVPVGGETSAQGFLVGVESVTDTQVVVRVRPGG